MPRAEACTGEAHALDGAAALDAEQRALASALVDPSPPTWAAVQRFGDAALGRTRTILARKRIDDALPHLPRLSGMGCRIRELADAILAEHPRARERVSLTDAWRILEAAAARAEFGDAAALDGLVLRARFHPPRGDGAVRPRVRPFIGRVHGVHRSTWALKGPGVGAKVHLVHSPHRSISPRTNHDRTGGSR
jgi:hypothetical protein